jgi:hypothetical protein
MAGVLRSLSLIFKFFGGYQAFVSLVSRDRSFFETSSITWRGMPICCFTWV